MEKLIIKNPEYWNQACRELSEKDKKLANLILKYSNLKIQSHGDPFTTLTRSIVGQQISVAAAESIWKKLYHLEAKYCGKYPEGKPFRPISIIKNYHKLNSTGLSGRKKEYIHGLAKHFESNNCFSKQLLAMNDEDITRTLISFPGIGDWTIKMFKIFCLMQPDIFPENDLSLTNAISKIYKIKSNDKKKENITKLSEKWKPWRTVATWYLWCSVDQDPVYY